MEAAKYDTPVKVEREESTPDPVYGRPVKTWISITGSRFLFAQVSDVQPSRSEAVRSGLAVATNQTRVRLPYQPGLNIDSKMRIRVFRERETVYQIVGGPAEIGRQEELELMCEKYSA
jgi:head-tail adaptor